MDISQFAPDPSDSRWGEPEDEDLWPTIEDIEEGKRMEPNTNTQRRAALQSATAELNSFFSGNAQLADVQAFLARWEDPAARGRVQPNALAWFNGTRAVESTCE